MSGWRWNGQVAAVALTLFLLVQMAVPVAQLITEHDRAQRFGWQMFAYATAIEFTLVTTEGEETVDLNDVMARPRADMDLEAVVPAHLCEVRPEAVAVTWEGGRFEC